MENSIELIKSRLSKTSGGKYNSNENDSEFIVNAKSDIEYLIEKCERYEKALNEIAYEKVLCQYTNVIDMAVDFKKIAQEAFKKNEQTK